MAENDKSFNNEETARQRDAPWNDQHAYAPTQVLSEQEGLCVSLSSIPPQEFPRLSHENTFGCCAQNDQSKPKTSALMSAGNFSTQFPQLSFLES